MSKVSRMTKLPHFLLKIQWMSHCQFCINSLQRKIVNKNEYNKALPIINAIQKR